MHKATASRIYGNGLIIFLKKIQSGRGTLNMETPHQTVAFSLWRRNHLM